MRSLLSVGTDSRRAPSGIGGPPPGSSWVSVAVLVAAVSALTVIVLLAAGKVDIASAQSTSTAVCDRTAAVRDAIVAATGADACSDVSEAQLRDTLSLDLSGQSITSLSSGDLDDFHSLVVLDLSDNSITTLPAGIFDELYLLEVLRLHNNSLQTLPAGIFDELFMLVELSLHGNRLTALPEGFGGDFSPHYGLGDDGSQQPGSGSYPRISKYIADNGITTAQQFIDSLPDEYKQRFVLNYESESPARPHVSVDSPRVVSFGFDGAYTFSWVSNPLAPSMFRDSVEFLRQNQTDWTAGVIDFSGSTPRIVEPSSCQSCHSPVNKPLWDPRLAWRGTEFVEATRGPLEQALALNAVKASTNPRLSVLDFSQSIETFRNERIMQPVGGGAATSLVVEEAGNVWSWRHAEVLYRILAQRYPDFRTYQIDTICRANPLRPAQNSVLYGFPQSVHNLAIPDWDPNESDVPGKTSTHPAVSAVYTYEWFPGGDIFDAVLFLMAADLWRDEPIVRRLYRNTSNSESLHQRVQSVLVPVVLHYPAGSANAEDELIQRLRVHFGHGGEASVRSRDQQNGKLWMQGPQSASFRYGHNAAMVPRVCAALRDSAPSGLSTSVSGGDVALNWTAPKHDRSGITGYRILRGVADGEPEVMVEDTGSTATTWTDEDPADGTYAYQVVAIYDGYYPGSPSPSVEVSVGSRPAAVGSFSATRGSSGVTLSWSTPTGTPAADGYHLYRGTSAYGMYLLTSSIAADATSYVDATAAETENYHYQVAAKSGRVLGPRSTTVRTNNASPQINSNRFLRMDENSTTATALVATDADGSRLTWTIPTGAAGGTDRSRFSITSSGSISFAAAKDFENPDDADTDGTYEVTVQVSDGTRSDTADLRVTLVDVNEAPSADAGPDQDSVTPGGTVTLAGSATDPDPGDSLTYAWSQTSGETVTLSDASVSAPTFTAPSDLTDDETIVFTLRVTDAGGLHARDTVTVTVEAEQFNGVMAGTMTVGTSTYRGNSVFGYSTRGDWGTFEVTAPADSAYLGSYGKLRIMMRAPGDVTLPSVGEVTDSVTFAYADELTLPFTLLFGETQLSSADAVHPDGDESRVGRFWVWENITPGWEVDDEVTVSVTTAEEQTTEEQTTEEQTTEEQVEPPQEEEEDTSDENSAATGTPTIDGTAQVGQTLTADTAGIADEDGLDNATYRYQWLADGTDISGATDSTYTLVTGDQGKAITVRVSFTDDENNAESLTSQPTAAVAPPPLTASFRSVPGSHDGSAPFTFELHFSEEPSLSYVTLRDSAFTESGGEVIKARRLTPGSNLAWEITVQPSSSATVTIVLPATTDCQDTGAICTADGRKLSNRNVLQIPGPSAQN